jgi:hypothetical protein
MGNIMYLCGTFILSGHFDPGTTLISCSYFEKRARERALLVIGK